MTELRRCINCGKLRDATKFVTRGKHRYQCGVCAAGLNIRRKRQKPASAEKLMRHLINTGALDQE